MNNDTVKLLPPKRIWLQTGSDEPNDYPPDHNDVSWCCHNVHGTDIEYVHVSREQELTALVEMCEITLKAVDTAMGGCGHNGFISRTLAAIQKAKGG